MVSYKQHALGESWDAIVVGSGIGGLATAALLSLHAGKRVLVLERHYTAGGYTHAFRRPGYQWDVGVHYIGEVHDPSSQLRALFDHVTDGQLQWQPMPDVYDRVMIGGNTFEFPAGRERFREQLKRYFPREASATDRYIDAVVSTQKAVDLYFAEKVIPRPLARLAGGLMRARFLRGARETTLNLLRRFTTDPDWIGLVTAQWGDYGLPPAQSSFGIHAIIAGHYFEGASYPVGGAERIAQTIAPLIERNGGQVVVSAEVAEVIVKNGKAVGVRMADGREFRSGIVISDAGARNTFDRLVRTEQPLRRELRRIPPSMAHLSLYVGVKQRAAELGLNGTNLWVYPTPDHDANFARFVKDPSAPSALLFISFPSAKDPEFERKYPGRATLEVVTLAPYDWFTRWEGSRWKRRAEDYETFKKELATRLQSELERLVPAVAGKIDHAELSTPLTNRHFMNYERGEAYGLAATPERFSSWSLTPRTSVPGLYLTGQDVTTLGVAGALFGGVATASAVLGKNLLGKIKPRTPATSSPRT
jgi:all-trans-retinol 13,14-reductase